VKKTILGEDSEDEGSDAVSDGEDDDDDDEGDDEEEDEQQMKIRDETETNLVNLRRTIYLTIMSSVDFEEAGHKLLKIKLEPGQEVSSTSLAWCCYVCAFHLISRKVVAFCAPLHDWKLLFQCKAAFTWLIIR
jgi:pre-mRNA-splicing factor CWC22